MTDAARDDGASELPEHALTELFGYGNEGEESPLDALAARLTRDDGVSWFAEAATTLDSALDGDGPPVKSWPETAPALDDVRALKKHCKRRTRDAAAEQDRLLGALGYVVTNAIALTAHQAKISSLPDGELRSQLRDFAAAFQGVDSSWSELLARSATAEV
ncbi:MAG: hypothetical protein AAF488_08265 [Planctomycetota bacterium]